METNERLHALDAVRAFALLAGIVLHATMSFMPGLTALGFPADSSQSTTLQTVFYVIHVFRMSLFFFIAGYFSHLMFHRKGTAGFVRDRARRILVPALVGWVAFGPIAMMLVYVSLAPPVNGTAVTPPKGLPLSHLWFLYYLLLMYAMTLIGRACFIKWLDRSGKARYRIDGWVRSLVHGYAAPAVLGLPIAAYLYFTPDWIMWSGIASPDTGLTPQLPAMIGFGTAFGFGWLMQRQGDLLYVWRRRWALHLAVAIALTAASLWIVGHPESVTLEAAPFMKLAYVLCYTGAMWHWVFGLIGSALRFLANASPARRYLADASYWMYLAHLPIVFALQLIVLQWPVHWSIKFPLIVGVTVALLLLSYHYLVRGTIIGEVLNGRRYARQPAANSTSSQVQAAAAASDEQQSASIVAELSGVQKRFGTTIALEGVDLQIRRGEVLALLGPNGAGKSTAISLLLGLQQPDGGSVRLFGTAPDLPGFIDARRQVGVMLQEVTLPADARSGELIDLASSYYPEPLPNDEVMMLTQTSAFAAKSYGKLSGGQQRLTQFAMAICGRPRLLFLDEPTTGLDIHARAALWATVRQLVSEGCSIVLTTHYLEEAEALADRIAVLARGRVVALGSVAEVRALVSRKRISCTTTLTSEQIRHWPGVAEVTVDGQRLHITASDAESVTRRLLAADETLRELEVTQAGLAAAFVELTKEAA